MPVTPFATPARPRRSVLLLATLLAAFGLMAVHATGAFAINTITVNTGTTTATCSENAGVSYICDGAGNVDPDDIVTALDHGENVTINAGTIEVEQTISTTIVDPTESGSLALDGSTEISNNVSIETNADQTYDGTVTLAGTTSLKSDAAIAAIGTIEGSDAGGSGALTVLNDQAANTVTIFAEGGFGNAGSDPLDSVGVTGETWLGADSDTIDAQQYDGTLTLTGSATLDSETPDPIGVTGPVTNTGGALTLTVDASSTTFGSSVGSSTDPFSTVSTSSATSLSGNVTTSGDQSYATDGSNLTIAGDSVLTATTAGAITVGAGGKIEGSGTPHGLEIDTTAPEQIPMVGDLAPLSSFTVDHSATLNGSVSTTGAQTYGTTGADTITLATNLALIGSSTTASPLDFKGAVSAVGESITFGGSSIHFESAVQAGAMLAHSTGTGTSIEADGSVTTSASQTYNGPLVIGSSASSTVLLSAGNAGITFDSTIDGPGQLTISDSDPGGDTISNAVGTTPLASFVEDDVLSLGANVTTIGVQTYGAELLATSSVDLSGSSVQLGGDLAGIGAGDVTISGNLQTSLNATTQTIDIGNYDFTVTGTTNAAGGASNALDVTAGDAVFGGAIGTDSSGGTISALTISHAASLGGDVTTDTTQTYGLTGTPTLTLTGTGVRTLTSTGGDAIAPTGAIVTPSGAGLALDTHADGTFGGNVGTSGAPLASLNVEWDGATLPAAVFTSGDQTYAATTLSTGTVLTTGSTHAVSLGGDVTGNNNSLTIDGDLALTDNIEADMGTGALEVGGATTGAGNNLDVDATSATFGGDIGTIGTPVGTVYIDGDAALGGSVYSHGAQHYGEAVTLTGDATLYDHSSGNVEIDGDVSGAFALTLDSNSGNYLEGNVDVASLSAPSALVELYDSTATITTTGDQDYAQGLDINPMGGDATLDGSSVTIAGALDAFVGQLNLTGAGTTTIAAGTTSNQVEIDVDGGTLQVDSPAFTADVTLGPDTSLTGTGSVGDVTTTSGDATVSPGDTANATAELTTFGLSLGAGSTFYADVNGASTDTVAPSDTIDLTGASLHVNQVAAPAVGTALTLIDNTSVSAVTGTFTGLAEGAELNVDGDRYQISYTGGTSHQDVTLTRVKQLSTIALAQSAQSGTAGDSVTLTATVTGLGGTPSGTVTFLNGLTTIGTATLTNGVATLTTTALPTGSDSLMASYGGDASYATSTTSSALAHTVNPAPVTTPPPPYTVVVAPQPTNQSLASVAKHGIATSLTVNEPGRTIGRVYISVATAKALGLLPKTSHRTGEILIGNGSIRETHSGTYVLHVKLSRSMAVQLAKHHTTVVFSYATTQNGKTSKTTSKRIRIVT